MSFKSYPPRSVNNLMDALISGSVVERSTEGSQRITAAQDSPNYNEHLHHPRERPLISQAGNISTQHTDSYVPEKAMILPNYSHSRHSQYLDSRAWDSSDTMEYRGHENPQYTTMTENVSQDRRLSQEIYRHRPSSSLSQDYADLEHSVKQQDHDGLHSSPRYHNRRRPINQDEFDGPSQYLPLPLPYQDSARAQELISFPQHLGLDEQEKILERANDILSECAFHFIAKYQFPVPIEREKPRIRSPADREWTEWAFLLKRLATKRRIPARVLYDNQIKSLVTTLENSIPARQTPFNKDQLNTKNKRKDDRYILQLISAGSQVAKILMDSLALQQLDYLYTQTENVILSRRKTGPIVLDTV